MKIVMFMLALFVASTAAHAEEEKQRAKRAKEFTANGVFCKTYNQAVTLINAYNGYNFGEALGTANGELTPNEACGRAIFEVSKVKEYNTVDSPTGPWVITKVLVHKVHLPNGRLRIFLFPFEQYAAFRPSGYKPLLKT